MGDERERDLAGTYREVLDQLTDSIGIVGRSDGRLLYLNGAGERDLGRDARSVVGQVFADLYPEMKGTPFFDAFERVAAGGPWESFEHHYAPWDRWYETRILPVRGAVCIAGRDVSARKRAEQQRVVLGERLRAMADSAPVLIWIVGPVGEIEYVNAGYLEFTGLSLEEALGPARAGRARPDQAPAWRAAYAAAAPAHERFEATFRVERADGEPRWLRAAGVPWYHPGGSFAGTIGSGLDITEIKRAEDEREQLLAGERVARGEAERASRMKDEFLATLSHELRTPLTSILGWTQMLKGGDLDAVDAAHALDVIERSTRLQVKLVSDLLDMSRIISGKVLLDVQRVDLAAVVNAAVETVRPAAHAKGIALERRLCEEGAPMLGDPARLQQVVWNLLSNAIKFTPRGGRVEIDLRRGDACFELAVADTGQGILPDFLPHVFERFRQGDATTTRRHEGLGLGLSIVKHMVELHGGTAHAASQGEGLGATFTISLPVDPPRW